MIIEFDYKEIESRCQLTVKNNSVKWRRSSWGRCKGRKMAVLKREQWERFRREYARMVSSGLTDVAIAREIGVTRQTISKWRELISSGVEHEGVPLSKVEHSAVREVVGNPLVEDAQSAVDNTANVADQEMARSNEAEWMKRLLARLLFENERLKAIVAGEIVDTEGTISK